MFTEIGKSHLECYNVLLAGLHLTENPKKYYESIMDKAFVLCFFFHDGQDYVLLGDEYDARYSRPFGKHVDVSRYKIKDDFQFKNRIWYNSEIYNWLLLLIIVGSFFVPLDDHAMIAIMLGSAIGIPVLYFSVRIYIHFKFKSMAKQIIKYHQRLNIVYDSIMSDRNPRHMVTGKSIFERLRWLGIDITKTDKY